MNANLLFNQIIKRFELNPKKLFLVDGFGAILTAFLLGIVLVKLERFFGIPSSALYFLATLPIFFAIYDFYCYKKGNDKPGIMLKRIAIMNLLYCCVSIGFAIYHNQEIKLFGWIYILNEVVIIVLLAIIELSVANRLNKNSHHFKK